MHGRIKVRTTEEQQERIKREQQKKLELYQKSMSQILNARCKNVFDFEEMLLTAKLLIKNPDIYTLWNYRKEAVLFWDENGTFEPKEILDQELDLTVQCLKSNPKSYSAWYHRFWILKHFHERGSDWQREHELCNTFLNIDDRNFHCWDYRRLIFSYLNITTLAEIEFTEKCLNRNFSNYSAWHHRSTLLDNDFFEDGVKINKEIQLFLNAAFTDPKDSSSWIYLKWFLINCKQFNLTYNNIYQQVLKSCQELISLEPDSKWALITLSFLMEELQISNNLLNEFYKKLILIDPNRKGFYEEKVLKFVE